jgi:hypothetical protein
MFLEAALHVEWNDTALVVATRGLHMLQLLEEAECGCQRNPQKRGLVLLKRELLRPDADGTAKHRKRAAQ